MTPRVSCPRRKGRMRKHRLDARVDELEAVARLREGDVSGLETLVRCHQVRALRVAYLIVGDPGLAQDVAQDAFLRAYDRIGSFDTARPFAPWFMRLVVNGSLDAASRGRRREVREAPLAVGADGTALDPSDLSPGPDALAEEADLRLGVLEALQELPPNLRVMVVQRYYLGMSEAEMARDGGIPAGTVKWRLHTARKRLSRILGQRPSTAATGVLTCSPTEEEDERA